MWISDSVGFQDDDVIITLGDYVNRGPNTRAVLDWLIQLDHSHNLVPLRGNHDIMMSCARNNESDYRQWLEVGGVATLRSYAPIEGGPGAVSDIPERHWQFLTERLLSYYETDSHFFVHANAYSDVALDDQPDFMLYWEKFNDPPRHDSGKIMVCGHTSQKSGVPFANDYAVCIDTWACGNGWLSCLEVETGKIWQANEQGATREMWLDQLPKPGPE